MFETRNLLYYFFYLFIVFNPNHCNEQSEGHVESNEFPEYMFLIVPYILGDRFRPAPKRRKDYWSVINENGECNVVWCSLYFVDVVVVVVQAWL